MKKKFNQLVNNSTDINKKNTLNIKKGHNIDNKPKHWNQTNHHGMFINIFLMEKNPLQLVFAFMNLLVSENKTLIK